MYHLRNILYYFYIKCKHNYCRGKPAGTYILLIFNMFLSHNPGKLPDQKFT